jgi:hypothetical protein
MVTGLLGIPHTKPVPSFALSPIQTSFGWGVITNPETAQRVANLSASAVLFDRDVTVTTGPLVRIKTPRVTKRGHRRLRIDAITPVCVRNSSSHWTHVTPTAANLGSTLLHHLPMRLGIRVEMDTLRLDLVERTTQVERVPLGGKYGIAGGWSGSCIVDTNAVLICFCVIAWRGLRVAVLAPDRFGAFLAVGLTMMVAIQAFVNISVALGLLPTKGIPLPFVSAGGSSLLINLLGMGVLLNVSQHAAEA